MVSSIVGVKTSGVTLASFVNDLVRSDEGVKRAQSSPEAAQSAYPELIKRVSKLLTVNGFENKIIVFKGFRKALKDAAKAVQELAPKDVEHAVIAVGQLVIDLCRARLGTTFDLPFNYQKNLINEFWVQEKDMTPINKLQVQDVKRMKTNYGLASGRTNMLGRDISLSADSGPLFARFTSDRSFKINDTLKIEKGDFLALVEGDVLDQYKLIDASLGRVTRSFRLPVKESEKLLAKCSPVTKAMKKKLQGMVKFKATSLVKVKPQLPQNAEVKKLVTKWMKKFAVNLDTIKQEHAIKILNQVGPGAEASHLKTYFLSLFTTNGKASNKLKAHAFTAPVSNVTVKTVKKPKAQPATQAQIVPATPTQPQKIKVHMPEVEEFTDEPFNFDPGTDGLLRMEAKNGPGVRNGKKPK